jgi:hypothetical protein
MDYESYRHDYFVEPQPLPRFRFQNTFAVTLYFEDYEKAIAYYENVLGPPSYVEGDGTHGWRIGNGWLTLLKGTQGSPTNVEVGFELGTPEEAERLQREFIAAGGTGQSPSDQLMYRPVRFCPVVDPFGTEILIIAQLGESEA